MTRDCIQSEDRSSSRHKPGLEDFLRAVGLDVAYHRAKGDVLGYRDADGTEIDVLDLVGGYGTLLFGHGHPEIVAAATEFLASGQANHVQGSVRVGANQLADALAQRVHGEYCTVFANSGAEAVEVALKHALLETGGRNFVALRGGFHGKTMGALGVTSSPAFRVPFQCDDARVIRIAANDLDQLKDVLPNVPALAGFIYEPIQGEAGVRPLDPEFVRLAATICAERDVPLIADECQTGVGRTGSFLASDSLGVTPDYVTLAKALGGGITKLSAVLIKHARYRPDFDLIHSSTFADDEFSTAIALRVLDLVDGDAISLCRSKGDLLLQGLRSLQRRFPEVIADVRGRGLMIGVELRRPEEQAGFILNHLAQRQLMGPLVVGHLLREHQIRIATTLSDSRTLRVQPSLLIEDQQIHAFLDAMTAVCEQLGREDVVGLTRFFLDRPPSTRSLPTPPGDETPIYHFRSGQSVRDEKEPSAANGSRHVAWIFHLIDSSDLGHLDPTLDALTPQEKTAFCDRWSAMSEPIVMDTIEISSSTQEVVTLHPILLPVTSDWMLQNSRGRDAIAPKLVQRAVDVAAAIGCKVVSLGQFTSIVTRGGASLEHHDLQITAGGNYTAALVNQTVRAALSQRSRDPKDLVLGVVGATGDIASTCASILAPDFRRSVLVGSGRVGSVRRLETLSSGIPRSKVATSLRALEQVDVVVCAVNSTVAPIGPEWLSPDAIVCDASVPAAISPCVPSVLPSVTICPGAVVELPNREHLAIPGFPLPTGYTYGCMAEGLLLGLDGREVERLESRSSAQQARRMSQLANRHGFRVATADVSDPRKAPHEHHRITL